MGRLVDENDVYNVLTEYYHHKTATQHVALIDALSTVKTADAIPLDWIRAYIDRLKDMGVQLSLRDAQAISVMVDKWAMDNSKCGPDYCEIGGDHK